MLSRFARPSSVTLARSAYRISTLNSNGRNSVILGIRLKNNGSGITSPRFCSSAKIITPDEINEDNNNKPSTAADGGKVKEKVVGGDTAELEFQAETRKLLDIVAKSLYSEKEVFVRELISNASDAVEKMRYLMISSQDELIKPERELKITIETDKIARKIVISDSGVGMTKEEMIDNLGTIARSGSKAFMQEVRTVMSANNCIQRFSKVPDSEITDFWEFGNPQIEILYSKVSI